MPHVVSKCKCLSMSTLLHTLSYLQSFVFSHIKALSYNSRMKTLIEGQSTVWMPSGFE